jgi:hypothetical protein
MPLCGCFHWLFEMMKNPERVEISMDEGKN